MSTGEEAFRKWPLPTSTTANCGRHQATGSTTVKTCSPSPWKRKSSHSSRWTAPAIGKLSQCKHLSCFQMLQIKRHLQYLMCVTVISCSLLVLQSHVQPQASLVEGASSEAGRLRGPPQKRAVRDADGADQSTALPAGWRSHFLHHGSGDHISSFQLWYTQFWGCLNMFWKTSYYLLYVLYSFLNHPFFFLHRSRQRWRAASTSSAVFTMCSDSPSSFTSPPVQRSIWATSQCGTRLRR